MQRNSKTLEEIYKEKYPVKELKKCPILCAEAVGYLRGILQFNPSEKWIKGEIIILLFMFTAFLDNEGV